MRPHIDRTWSIYDPAGFFAFINPKIMRNKTRETLHNLTRSGLVLIDGGNRDRIMPVLTI